MVLRHFTLEYWIDEGWYVGRLKEIPSVFSQGETLQELEDNIRDAYKLVVEEGLRLTRLIVEFRQRRLGLRCETAGFHSRISPVGLLPEASWETP